MNSGVRKSGWPIPRLMMSRPWAASALARASTAKAFSSPMRSNAAMVFSMGFPVALIALLAAGLRPASTAAQRRDVVHGRGNPGAVASVDAAVAAHVADHIGADVGVRIVAEIVLPV